VRRAWTGKRLAPLALAACACAGLACGDSVAPAAAALKPASEPVSVSASAPGSVAPGSFPRRIESPVGVWIELAAAPRRIVPANAGAVDLLTLLVGPERIAALPRQALDYSVLADAPLAQRAPYEALPRFERYLAEPLLAANADLVVSDPWGALETTARLREARVPVLELPDVTSWADVERGLETLAFALGVEQRGAEQLALLRARHAALLARAAGRGARALAYSYYGSQGSSAGAKSTLGEVLELAGLRNAAAHLRGHATLSFEDLIALDPDWILVAHLGEGEGQGGTAALLRSTAVLRDLRAVRENHILELPARMFASTSQQLLDAAERLSAALEQRRSGARGE
jgi:iron complex transport system substrate-binding protein